MYASRCRSFSDLGPGLAAVFGLAALCGGCGADTITKLVGADGLVLTLPGGAILEIPAGALPDDVQIEATVVTDLVAEGWQALPDLGAGAAVAQFAVALEPHGLRFEQPVTLTLPFTEDSAGFVVLRSENPYDPEWHPIGPITRGDGVITVQITQFSGYALTVIPDGACPCWDAIDVTTFFAAGRAQTGWREWVGQSGGPLGLVGRFDGPQSSFPGLANFAKLDTNNDGPAPAAHRMCQAYVSDGPVPAATLAGEFFSGLTPDASPPEYWMKTRLGISTPGVEACAALIRAGAAGGLGTGAVVTTAGLPTGETLTLVEAGGASLLVDRIISSGLILPTGEDYAFEIGTQPTTANCTVTDGATGTAGATGDTVAVLIACTAGAANAEVCDGLDDDGDGLVDEGFDEDCDGVTTCGPDGVVSLVDDDCDDADANTFPGAPELCDAVDNDCDSVTPPGETTDGDGDGLADACDGAPTQGCPCYDLADVIAAGELSTPIDEADCWYNGIGAVPEVALTGAAVSHAVGVYEVAGLLQPLAGGNFACGFGCYDYSGDNPTFCSEAGRPALVSTDLLSTEVEGCLDLAAQGCPLVRGEPPTPLANIEN